MGFLCSNPSLCAARDRQAAPLPSPVCCDISLMVHAPNSASTTGPPLFRERKPTALGSVGPSSFGGYAVTASGGLWAEPGQGCALHRAAGARTALCKMKCQRSHRTAQLWLSSCSLGHWEAGICLRSGTCCSTGVGWRQWQC